MTKLFVLLLALSCPFVDPASAEDAIPSPFVMPPSGKPDALIGGVDLEGPIALAFDSDNRPYMFEAREPEHFGYMLALRDGEWIRLDYLKALQKASPQVALPEKRWHHAYGTIAVDGKNRLYAVVQTGGKWFLLYSENQGTTFSVCTLPGRSFLEIYTGHNHSDLPPAIGCLRRRKNHPAPWTAYHDLEVFFPTKNGEGLQIGKPVHVTADCFGVSNHSGGYSFAATLDAKTHLTYAEIPQNGSHVRGNPTYVATIDRNTMRVTTRKHIADALPKEKSDVHSTPVIAADKAGFLHVLAGAHGQQFLYTHTTAEATVNGDWSRPAPQTTDRQTYATLVCDSHGRLHCVYRHHDKHGSLRYVTKSPGASTWSEPIEIVMQPKGHSGYTVFYHRLFIDRADALYLSFTFYEFHTKDEGRYPRVLAMSDDSGKTWRLATTAEMQARVARRQ